MQQKLGCSHPSVLPLLHPPAESVCTFYLWFEHRPPTYKFIQKAPSLQVLQASSEISPQRFFI